MTESATAMLAPWIGLTFAVVFIWVGLEKYVHGIDGTVSLSNVQLVLWSGTILGSYVGLAMLKGDFLRDIPPNLLGLIGVRAGSYVTGVGIRTVQEMGRPSGSRRNHLRVI